MSNKISKKKIIIFSLLAALGVGIFVFTHFSSHKSPSVPSLIADGRTINFSHTDGNDRESLIIKSDQQKYSGFDGSDVYFSVTNTSKTSEPSILLFYFPGQFIPSSRDEPPGIKPATVMSVEQRTGDTWQKLEFFNKNIKLNDSLLGKAVAKRKPIPEDFTIKAGIQVTIQAGQTLYFKSRIAFPPGNDGEFWIEALGKNGGYGLLDPFYSSSWSYRKKISINHFKVSGGSNLSNFPVLVNITDANLATTANGGKAASGSGEFVFTSSDGVTVLPHEIETYSATTGQFIGWVNVTTLSVTQDTDLYLYYGGPSSGATNQNKTGTWDSNYKGVWHLPNGTTLTALDSTSNANNGTISGPTATTGQVDGGANFSGNQTIDVGSGLNATLNGSFTVEGWANLVSGTAQLVWGKRASTYSRLLGYGIAAAGEFDTADENNAYIQRVAITVNTFKHFVWTYDNTGHTSVIYLNGISISSVGYTFLGDQTTTTGFSKDDNNHINGATDEWRVSNITRSADWITTEYNNQSSPRTFYTYGGAEVNIRTLPGVRYGSNLSSDSVAKWYASGSSIWNNRKRITIFKSKVSGGSNLSNFPVLISLTDANLATTANGGKAASGSGEFVFTSSNGTTSLPYEIETYSATTGQFIGWVNVTTLSATQDTYLYMYFNGPSSGATNQNKTGTWDSNYKGVWHLPNGTTLTLLDSTSNANNGTNQGGTAAAGQVDGGMGTNGSSTYMDVANSTSLNNITAAITVSSWIKRARSATRELYIAKGDVNGGLVKFWMELVSADNLQFYLSASGDHFLNATDLVISDTNWHHIVGTWDGSTMLLYKDRNLSSQTIPFSGSLTVDSVVLGIGRPGNYNGLYFSGTQDEVRVSNTARSADWITTEYNNQSSPSTFYFFGSLEARAPANPGLRYGSKASSDSVANWYTSGSSIWNNRKRITIFKSKVSGGSNLSNFPVLISLTDANLATTANGGKAASGSGEFIFTSSNGTTSLPYEIETYSATTGQFIGWVNVTTLSATQDTYLYMYFNGPAAGGATNQNKTGTWDSNYKGVWHLPNGTTLTALDSTSNANNGTITNATAAAGQINGDADFGTAGTAYIVSTNVLGISGAGARTVSLWAKWSDAQYNNALLDIGFQSANTDFSLLALSGNWFLDGFGGGNGYNTGNAVDALWHYHSVIYDGVTAHWYKDGVEIGAGFTHTYNTTNEKAYIGERQGGTGSFSQYEDEIRVSNIARSTDWITTEYNNQSSPSTFYFFGSLEARAPANPGLKLK